MTRSGRIIVAFVGFRSLDCLSQTAWLCMTALPCGDITAGRVGPHTVRMERQLYSSWRCIQLLNREEEVITLPSSSMKFDRCRADPTNAEKALDELG